MDIKDYTIGQVMELCKKNYEPHDQFASKYCEVCPVARACCKLWWGMPKDWVFHPEDWTIVKDHEERFGKLKNK